MKRLTTYLEEPDLARLEVFARERGWARSQAARAAIRALLRQRSSDPVLDLSGDIDGLPRDLGRKFGRHLNATFKTHRFGVYRVRGRPRVP